MNYFSSISTFCQFLFLTLSEKEVCALIFIHGRTLVIILK